MVGVGRDLCGSSSPTLLPKQGHLQQAVEDLVQVGIFEAARLFLKILSLSYLGKPFLSSSSKLKVNVWDII